MAKEPCEKCSIKYGHRIFHDAIPGMFVELCEFENTGRREVDPRTTVGLSRASLPVHDGIKRGEERVLKKRVEVRVAPPADMPTGANPVAAHQQDESSGDSPR